MKFKILIGILFLGFCTIIIFGQSDSLVFTTEQSSACQSVKNQKCSDYLKQYIDNLVIEAKKLKAIEIQEIYNDLDQKTKDDIQTVIDLKKGK